MATEQPEGEAAGAEPAGAETAGVALGARPEADPLEKALARAKVTAALLGTDEKVKLGRYHLLEKAGAGGMGVVYAAWDPDLDRRVAIKIMRVEASAKRERALAEGQVLAKLSHPNIVTVHDVGVFDEQLYLVMEWVRGKNLRQWNAERRTVRDIVGVYRAAGEGLLAAHEAGIVHRDFKPDNAMVGDDGRVRVVDFGLALAEQDAPAAKAGTPRYMAPEQHRGEAVTTAADQYAFCFSLREALATRVEGRGVGARDARESAGAHEERGGGGARDAREGAGARDAGESARDGREGDAGRAGARDEGRGAGTHDEGRGVGARDEGRGTGARDAGDNACDAREGGGARDEGRNDSAGTRGSRGSRGREAAVPAWIAAIVERGTASDITARYPGMVELLRALARDPRTVWRRRLLVAAAVAMAGIAFAVGFSRSGVEHCTGAPEELAHSWNPALRDRVIAHLRELGPYGAAEAERIAAQLTAYGEDWSKAHRGACVARERDDITPQLYERGLGCLARARVALETVGGVLGSVPIDRLGDAILASRGLPQVERCLADTAASPVAPPPDAIARDVDKASADVARASTLALAGDPTAAQVAAPAAVAADKLGYAPLRAKAQIALGSALATEGKMPESIAAYERAMTSAIDGGDDVSFVEAFARELFTAGRTPRDKLPADATDVVASLKIASRVAERTGVLGSFARALLYNNAGTTRLAAGDTPGAQKWFKQAYDVPQPGKRPIELSVVLGNLASTTEDATERARLFGEERTHLETELGRTHVVTLAERVRSMQFTTNGAVVARELDELCNALMKWHPQRADKIDPCAYEWALLARTLGDTERAKAALALVSKNDTEPRNRLARATERLLAGDATTAAADAAKVADENAKKQPWWARFWAVEAWLLEANARVALGDTARAIEATRSALTMLASPGFDPHLVYLQRRTAAARALLATLLTGPEAAQLADEAASWYRASGGYEAIKAPGSR